MAQQESIVKLKGRAGGLTFFENNNGYQARSSKGVDRQRVKKDPSFKRSRENASEFGRAVKSAKYLRNILRPLLIHSPDGTMVSRLNSRFTRLVKADDVNIRGERQASEANADILRFFDFNREAPLHETLLVRYQVCIDAGANQVSLQLPAFYPKAGLVSPKEATHFRMVAAAVCVDFGNMKSETYDCVSTRTTDLLPITGQISPFSLSLPIDGEPSEGSIIVVLGVSFFEELRGELYPMKAKESHPLGIVEVSRIEK